MVRPIVAELFLFLVKVNTFFLTYFTLSYFILSTFHYLFISYFTLPLLNSPNTIFFNLRVEKNCLHYYGMEGVVTYVME